MGPLSSPFYLFLSCVTLYLHWHYCLVDSVLLLIHPRVLNAQASDCSQKQFCFLGKSSDQDIIGALLVKYFSLRHHVGRFV